MRDQRRTLLAAFLFGAAALLYWLLAQPWLFRLVRDAGAGRYVLLSGLDVARDANPVLAPAALVLACRLVAATVAAFVLTGLLTLGVRRRGRSAYGLLFGTTLVAFLAVAAALTGVAEHTRAGWQDAPTRLAAAMRSGTVTDVGDLLVLRLSGYAAADAVRALHHVRGYLESVYWTARAALLLVALPIAAWAVLAGAETGERRRAAHG